MGRGPVSGSHRVSRVLYITRDAGIDDGRRSSEQKTQNERYPAHIFQAHVLISRPRGAHMCTMGACNMSPRTMRAAARGRVEAKLSKFQRDAWTGGWRGGGSRGSTLNVRTKHPFKYLVSFL